MLRPLGAVPARRPDPGWTAATLVTAALLLAYNNLIAGVVPAALYVPVNLLAGGLMVAVAVRWGLSGVEIAGPAARLRPGLGWGALVALGAAVVVTVAWAVPGLRPLLEDERVAGAGWGLVAYRAFVRIPLGTALFEEAVFRGVLLAAWARWQGWWRAVLGSSVVFGLWHIRPTLELLDVNEVAEGWVATAMAMGGGVAVTTIGGIFFALLRVRSGSLAAPVLAHAAINSAALLAAAAVT